MDDIFSSLTKKKKQLDALRPLSADQLMAVNDWLDIEYTYTSNWIEGNTLSRQETALILEKGITIEGKSLREHLEATNHLKAINFIRSIVSSGHQFITENTICDIHKIILTGVNDVWAGNYRQAQVFIRGASVEPPRASDVPIRMMKLTQWLGGIQGEHPVKVASDFHFRFVEIHPFMDGNGRTARLLSNLILLGHGYPMMIIKTNERKVYMDAIEKGTITHDLTDFYLCISKAVERSLNSFIALAKGKSVTEFYIDQEQKGEKKSLFIGKIAKLANVSIPTIRHYMAIRLIEPDLKSKGGFLLFDIRTVDIIRRIKTLQEEKRMSLEEIKQELKK